MEIKDIEKTEEERMEKLLEDRVDEIFEKTIKEKGRAGLKELYRKAYPEYEKIFLEKEPRYYRIATAYASEYNEKNNPLLVFLRGDISNENDFWNYFKHTPETFLERAKEGYLVPLIGPARIYEGNTFYEKFFDKWHKEFGFYPPNANRLEKAILAGKSFEDYKQSFKDELEGLIKSLPRDTVTYDPSGRLPPMKTEDFFPERFAWFKIAKMEDVIEDVKRILKQSAKKSNSELLDLAARYTFSSHQIFTSHLFYSKGGYVVLSPEDDLPVAIETFRKIIQSRPFIETLAGKIHWIFLSNLLIEAWSKIRRKIEIPVMKLPSIDAPKSAEKIQREISKSEEIQTGKEDVTNNFNNTVYATEDMDLSKIEEKYNDLKETVENLGKTYYEKLGAKYKLISTALLGGVEVALALIHPESSHIVVDYLVFHEGFDKGIIQPIIDRFSESQFRERLYGGIFGNLVIPLDIWKLGVRELPVVYKRK